MTYATQQDLIDRFGEAEITALADRDGDGEIDAEVVAKALAGADAVIDGYVGRRYDLPLSTVPNLVAEIAGDVARHKLFKDDPPEAVTKNFEAAMRLLRDIADGRIVLDVLGSEPAAPSDGVRISAPARVNTGDTMKGF